MRCIQDTTRRYSTLEWPGAAPDSAFDLLESGVSRRLRIAAGHSRSCCGTTVDLIAADPSDPSLPEQTRAALMGLTPGHAVAALELPELASGWIAMPGVDIRIDAQADLGGPAVAITFDDALALLSAPGAQDLIVSTIAVVPGRPTPPPGWDVVLTDVANVPLALGNRGHLAGCAA